VCPENVESARRLVAEFVVHYNEVRLHSALGYIAPADKLVGLEQVIFAQRDRKLEAASEGRRQHHQAQRARPRLPTACETEDRERLAGVQGGGNEPTWSPESIARLT
jgi:hypothetical protein